jgi:hypothetical protein
MAGWRCPMRARIIHAAATLATTVLAVGIAFGTKWGAGG